MKVESYLYFDGRCEEAIAFYRQALGAEVEMLMHYRDAPGGGEAKCPDGTVPPGEKVMHAQMRIGEARVLASDGRCEGRPEFKGFGLALSVADEAEAEKVFAALGKGGQVQMPLAKTFFSPRFGMVTDPFGVSWMVLVAH